MNSANSTETEPPKRQWCMLRYALFGVTSLLAMVLVLEIAVLVFDSSEDAAPPSVIRKCAPVAANEPPELLSDLGAELPKEWRARPGLTYAEDVTQWEILRTIKVPLETSALALSHDGKTLAVATNTLPGDWFFEHREDERGVSSLFTFDLVTGSRLTSLTLGSGRVMSMIFDSNDEVLLLGDNKGTVKTMSLKSQSTVIVARLDFEITSIRFNIKEDGVVACGLLGQLATIALDPPHDVKLLPTRFFANERRTFDALECAPGVLLIAGVDWDHVQRHLIYGELIPLDGTPRSPRYVEGLAVVPFDTFGDVLGDGEFIVCGRSIEFALFSPESLSVLGKFNRVMPPTSGRAQRMRLRILDSAPLILVCDDESMFIVDGHTGLPTSGRNRARPFRQKWPQMSRLSRDGRVIALTTDDDRLDEEIAIFRVK